MRKWITRRRALVILSLTAVWLAVWYWCFVPAHWRGTVAAYVHGTFGYDQVKKIGMPPRWEAGYNRLAWDRYKVWFDEAGDYNVSGAEQAYARGYNAVSVPRLRKRYGKDYWEEFAPLEDEARASLRRKEGSK
jgi:hypothetical protein